MRMPVADAVTATPPALSLARQSVIAVALGILTGFAAGLVGVGGGEFRMPVLIYLFRRDLRMAAGVNLVVGLFTVCLSFARRWGHLQWSADVITLTATFAITSLVGAVLGAHAAHRLPTQLMRRVVCGYLLVVGVWMIVEACARVDWVLFQPAGLAQLALAAVCGFVIAAISAALGVAGGEMRIPALMYLFAVPIKAAGTISLMISIPTVAAGAVTYRRNGHIPNHVLVIAVGMGLASLVGVMAGTALLPYTNAHVLKGILGAVILLATGALLVEPSTFTQSKVCSK